MDNLIGGKKLFAVAGLLALGTFAPAMFAQSGQEQSSPPAATKAETGTHRHENPYANLNLTEDQKAQIKKIHMDARAKAEAAKADSSLSEADKKAKMEEIHKTARMEADKVLTPEQREQLKKERTERRAERQNPS